MTLFQTEHPASLLAYLAGGVFSACGALATAVAGLAGPDMAMQPIHVVLVGFIVALAAFLGLVLRTIWREGITTMKEAIKAMNRSSAASERSSAALEKLVVSHEELSAKVDESMEARQQPHPEGTRAVQDFLDSLRGHSSFRALLNAPPHAPGTPA